MLSFLKNNKGYMLVEIILASVLAFGVVYFILSLTIKLKNKNDDLMVKTEIKTDQSIVTNYFMKKIYEQQNKFLCSNIIIDGNTIKYKNSDGTDSLIDKVSNYATVNTMNCKVTDDYVKIYIPINVNQQSEENFDIDIFYRIQNDCLTAGSGIKIKDDLYFSYVGEDQNINCINDATTCYELSYLENNWEIKFKVSGTLKFNYSVKVDSFLVGGGGGGGSAESNPSAVGSAATGSGGDGGDGGNSITQSIVLQCASKIIVGAGGNSGLHGDATSIYDLSYDRELVSITGGKGGSEKTYNELLLKNGGKGGIGAFLRGDLIEVLSGSTPGGPGVCKFGENESCTYFGGGGGGGSAAVNNESTARWTYSVNSYIGAGAGGSGGGGAGGYSYNGCAHCRGYDGGDNTGGGGGGGAPGGWCTSECGDSYLGGKGGSGVVIIRSAH